MTTERLAAHREATAAIAQILQIPLHRVQESPSLLDLPGFDSVAVVAVLERLENVFGVEVPPELIVPEAFASIDALAELFIHATPASAR